MLASSGYVCRMDQERCVSCETCVDLCQFSAIDLQAAQPVDEDKCMGCGVCVNSCPEEALSLELDPGKGEPLEIHNLMAQRSEAVSSEEFFT